MGRRKGDFPSYRLHKPSGLGVATVEGKDHYFGPFADPASRRKYDQLHAAWLANDRKLPKKLPSTSADEPTCISVAELVTRFYLHAESYYVRADGTPTGEATRFRIALDPLRERYGLLPVDQFGPNSLKAIREHYIERGMTRRTVNGFTDKVKLCFKWGASCELVSPNVIVALGTVAGLRMGRSKAVEGEPTVAANDADINKLLPHLRPTVRALVILQRATGARAGELLQMRPMDLDRSGEPWWFTPATHKSQHRGKTRRIALGPKAREALAPLLKNATATAYLFLTRQKRRLTTVKYADELRYVCGKHKIKYHRPHSLRHARLTEIRDQMSIDNAQAVGGHSTAKMTEHYAKLTDRKAAEAAEASG
jgi:integrase